MGVTRNGKAYGDDDVTITMFGSVSWEITNFEYGIEEEATANYSLGSKKMTSYITGKEKGTASLTMRLSSISAIEKAAGGKLLSIKPFTINVTIVNEDNDVINDTLTVKFIDQGRTFGGGDDAKKQLKLFVIDIDFNNA